MKTILLVWLVLLVVATVCRLVFLTVIDYPRITKHSRGEDAFGVVINLALAIWIVLTVWG